MTGTERSGVSELDWDAGIRQERRRDGLLSLCVTATVVGFVLLRFDLPTTTGRVWVIAGVLTIALVAAQHLANGVGQRRAETMRVRHAIREHVDPGPEWRDRADAQADRESQGWLAWLYPLVTAIQLPGGRWEEPATAIPGAILLMAGGLGAFVWYRRLAAASRRWLDDPPGPSRELGYSPPRDQRPWSVSARQGALLVVLVSLIGTAMAAAYLTLV